MTNTELNESMKKFILLNLKQSGLKDTLQNRLYLTGVTQTEWLLEKGWERTQPCFWKHQHHKDFYFVTDNHKLELYVWSEEQGELVLTEELPHPVL